MSDIITPEIFSHLVHLAALELEPAEAEYLRKELNNQLKAVRELEAIPLSQETLSTSHGVSYTPETTPPLRSDEWQAYANPEAIIQQAPQTKDGLIVVPDISHTEL